MKLGLSKLPTNLYKMPPFLFWWRHHSTDDVIISV